MVTTCRLTCMLTLAPQPESLVGSVPEQLQTSFSYRRLCKDSGAMGPHSAFFQTALL